MLKRFCATAGPEGTVVLQYSHGFEGCRAFRSWLCSVYPPPDLGMLQDTWLLSLANLQHHGIFFEFLVSGNDCFKLPSWLEFVQVAGARICRLQEGLWGSCPFGCQGADGFLAFFLTYSKSTENASYVSNLYDRAWMNRKQLRWGGFELVASIVVPSWGHSDLFFFWIGNIILWRIYVTRRFQVHQYLPSAHQLSLQGNQATRLPCAAPGSLVEPKKNPNRIPSLKLKWSPQKTNVCKINLSVWAV